MQRKRMEGDATVWLGIGFIALLLIWAFSLEQKEKNKMEIEELTQESLYELELFTNDEDQEINNTVKRATALHEHGKTNLACSVLSNIQNELDVHRGIKLVMYLQKAGKFNKSLIEMDALFLRVMQETRNDFGHQNKIVQFGIAFQLYSTLFDKLRLLHQREKKYNQVLYFGMMSIACKVAALNLQKRYDEVPTEEYISERFVKYSKKTDLDDETINEVWATTSHFLKKPTRKEVSKYNEVIAHLTNSPYWEFDIGEVQQ